MNRHVVQRRPGDQYMDLDDFEELMLDKPEDEKWELINGRLIRAMVGARWEHHFIIRNLDIAISNHLRARGNRCYTFRETFFLKERKDDLAALPDLMVRCGQLPPGASSINDPIVVIEVVSPGSEARDRLDKRIAYQALAALQTYVLIERDRPFIDVYERGSQGFAAAAPLQGAEDVLRLPVLQFEMSLADIYRDVLPPAV